MSLPSPGLAQGEEWQRLAKQNLDPVIAGKKPFREVSTNYTADSTDYLILVDATSGAVTITLPKAAIWAGFPLVVKKVDSSTNAVTLDADGAETIDGATTYVLSEQYGTVEVLSDGEAWHVGSTNPAILRGDPGGDRLYFWDDSEGRARHLTLGTGLSITDTTLNGSGAAGGGWATVVKSATQTRNSTTSFADDSELTATLAAGTWTVRGVLLFGTVSAADFKWQTAFSGTATVIAKYGMSIDANGSTGATHSVGETTHLSMAPVGSSTGAGRASFEIVLTVTVSGTFSIQWAQNTSDAGNTSVKIGSFIEYLEA